MRDIQDVWREWRAEQDRVQALVDSRHSGWLVWYIPHGGDNDHPWKSRKNRQGKLIECTTAEELCIMIDMAEDLAGLSCPGT